MVIQLEIQKRYGIRRLALTKPSHARNIIRKVLVAIMDKGDEAAASY
jgi:hypothetical protein